MASICWRAAGLAADTFAREDEIAVGAGANETPLTPETEPLCRDLFSRLLLSRHGDGAHTDPLFRLQPERWLEARLRAEIAEFFAGLPAISATRRCPRSTPATGVCSTF